MATAIEDDLEKPTQFYIVKDYERNLHYGSMNYALRPGIKKEYDPFLKAFERKDAFWQPTYYGQQVDLTPLSMLVMIVFLPIFTTTLFYFESRYYSYREEPLGYNMAAPSEYS